jgi:hypothetical protein
MCACGAAFGFRLMAGLARADDTSNPKMPLAACGLDCNSCGLSPKKCNGCHGPDDKVWSPQCKMRSCCYKTRKLSNCSECTTFPCEHVIAFENDTYAHHKKAIARLRKMHEETHAANRPAG